MALRQIQEYVISPLLRATPGVAEVNTSGGYERQIVVMPDPARLASAGLSLDELAHCISENTGNAGGGLVEIGGEQIVIRANSRVGTTEEIAQLPLNSPGRRSRCSYGTWRRLASVRAFAPARPR